MNVYFIFTISQPTELEATVVNKEESMKITFLIEISLSYI